MMKFPIRPVDGAADAAVAVEATGTGGGANKAVCCKSSILLIELAMSNSLLFFEFLTKSK